MSSCLTVVRQSAALTHPQAYGSLVGDYHFHNNNDSCQQIHILPSPFGEGSGVRLSSLSNRPDVKAAEYALKAQMAQVDVARAAFYPQLTISAAAGWTNNVGEIVNPGQMLLSAIGSLVQPLFNKG